MQYFQSLTLTATLSSKRMEIMNVLKLLKRMRTIKRFVKIVYKMKYRNWYVTLQACIITYITCGKTNTTKTLQIEI